EWRIVNAISSGVALAAAKMMSPSFSRSSSSTTTTALPAAMSATARSTESRRTSTPDAPPCSLPPCSDTCSTSLRKIHRTVGQQFLHVLGDDVGLQVDLVTGPPAAERRAGERLRDQAHREPVRPGTHHGEADP